MPDGLVRHLSVSGDPRFSPEGAFIGYRGVGRDITEIALARKHIASLAYSDPLTGLANRTSFMPSLDQAVRARGAELEVAVVFLDLDGFKEINGVRPRRGRRAPHRARRSAARQPARERPGRAPRRRRVPGGARKVRTPSRSRWWRKAACGEPRPYALPEAQASVTASLGISLFPDDAADAAR